ESSLRRRFFACCAKCCGPLHKPGSVVRGVAQPGRAPALGAGCRRFESSRPDHFRAEPRKKRRKRMALARIYRPSKTAMQSGTALTGKWLLEYEQATKREPDPLMGWISAGDTLNQIRLRFDTLEEALAFAKREGLDYTIIEPQQRAPKAKSYADNFRFDRVR